MNNKKVYTEEKKNIGIIVLNNVENNNTFDVELASQLNENLLGFDSDKNIRVVIVKANGNNFSMGISLDEFKDKTHREYTEFIRLMDKHNHTIAEMKKPVIASVQGYAVANGAGLVFASDLAVAGESAKIGTTAINVGLICLGPASPLVRLVGRKKALEMILTGEILTAQEAKELGLINRVVPDTELENETLKLGELLASKSPFALMAGKRGVYALQDVSYHEGIDYMSELFAGLCATEDAEEGVKAFIERRKPLWKMK
ncbi:MAG: enoyl-CoA hydratase/isomerase family protein [Spirochaetales bacterium]|nr:enoyl-CoA hydratase/isomerase family protein [Spirochaetales bacterium]